MPDHHSGLSRVRATRGARATTGPAEAAADSHSESIAVRATAPRESARHAAHIILACRASRSGSARVRVRLRTRAYSHVSSAATKHSLTRSTDRLRLASLPRRVRTRSAARQNAPSFGTFPKIAYNNYAYVSLEKQLDMNFNVVKTRNLVSVA